MSGCCQSGTGKVVWFVTLAWTAVVQQAGSLHLPNSGLEGTSSSPSVLDLNKYLAWPLP